MLHKMTAEMAKYNLAVCEDRLIKVECQAIFPFHSAPTQMCNNLITHNAVHLI